MNAQTRIVADSGPPDYRAEVRELRDKLQASQLRSIRLEGIALRACWAMIGLCNEAERLGVDVSYWRDLAGELEGRAQ